MFSFQVHKSSLQKNRKGKREKLARENGRGKVWGGEKGGGKLERLGGKPSAVWKETLDIASRNHSKVVVEKLAIHCCQ